MKQRKKEEETIKTFQKTFVSHISSTRPNKTDYHNEPIKENPNHKRNKVSLNFVINNLDQIDLIKQNQTQWPNQQSAVNILTNSTRNLRETKNLQKLTKLIKN